MHERAALQDRLCLLVYRPPRTSVLDCLQREPLTQAAMAPSAHESAMCPAPGGQPSRSSTMAVAAVFTTLAGMGAALRGLLFDGPAFVHYGALALIAGVASFVILLAPNTGDDAWSAACYVRVVSGTAPLSVGSSRKAPQLNGANT